MRNIRKIQLVFSLLLFTFIIVIINNLTVNLIRTNMGISFSWLSMPAGFAISEHSVPYAPSNIYAWALVVGFVNSVKIIICGLILATLIGLIVGFARFSSNILLVTLSRIYVGIIRQIPLLLQLLFWYFVVILNLNSTPLRFFSGLIEFSNQGLEILGVEMSSEFTALLVGLSVFTSASISEIIRGGINSVSKGQWEAYESLGLTRGLGLRLIIFPQALPAIIPGLTSQYLNLAKNSTLAIAVGYADLYAISDTTITQTGRSVEGFIILIFCFLLLNMLITRVMETFNSLITKKKEPIEIRNEY